MVNTMLSRSHSSLLRRCFIIAEVGVNHNGQLDLAKKLVEAAVSANVDAVKFQTFHAEALTTRSMGRAPYQQRSGISSHYDMLKGLELSYQDHEDLKQHCEDLGIEFMSTAYDENAARFLKKLGVRRIKIASADIVNRPLLETVAEMCLPVIQSTGMATLNEVDRAVNLLRSNGVDDLTLMHCVSNYPLNTDQVNMQWMQTLRQAFNLSAGYSDHTMGIEIPIMAVSLGAVMIEKHLTLDRGLGGPDQAASLEPDELRDMVRAIRNVEQAVSDRGFGLADQELENVVPMRRSLHAVRAISAGQVIQREDLAVLRPAVGLDPWQIDLVLGRTARENIDVEQPITWDVI
jgi:N,N'-diacetyllegionaminate synthase